MKKNSKTLPSMGVVLDKKGASFTVFSSVADAMELCLFDDRGSESRTRLTKQADADGLWHVHVPGVKPGQIYGYRVHGPWEPSNGHLCCPDKLLLDPYARAMHGQVQWNDALLPRKTDARDDTAPYMPKSVVVRDNFDWGRDKPPAIPIDETIIYEAHARGFTARHPDVPPGIRGTYAGLAHHAAIAHLRDLGVTAVELLPVQQFVHRRRLIAAGLRNYWGYDPVGYFAPHNEYASVHDPQGCVEEFKGMVKALHAAGMEVIIDVVYNHTAEGGSDGCILCFKGFDNSAYYRLDPGNRARYVDYTGTQNTLNAEHPMVRRMILDSLEYWVREMHVDGFRFDLAPALLREGATVNPQGAFIEAVRGSPVLRGVKLIAEPWDIGEGGYQLGRFPSPWREWNDRYRDSVRDFWRGHGSPRELTRRLTGSPDIFLPPERCPLASINYVTCHDGFTLRDLVSYETRHNEANLEENRDGQQDNHSWNCGVEGESEDAGVRALREKQMRNLLATLLISRGAPMILAGDEFGRSQRGNNNAYCHDNELSWLQWGCVETELKEFVASLVRIRSTHPALGAGHRKGDEDVAVPLDLAVWYRTDGLALGGADWDDPNMSAFQIHFAAGRSSSGANNAETDLIVLLNRSNQSALFNLPPPIYGKPVQLLLHTDSVAALSWTAYTNRISMPGHSLAIASCG